MRHERQEKIQEAVNQHGFISFAELMAMFPQVSEMTLRTDLKSLDQEGKIVRIHGGARSLDTVRSVDLPLTQRLAQHIGSKQEIARKAAPLVQPGNAVFLDSGSTMTELARVFPNLECTVFCGGLSCIHELSRLKKPDISVLGGHLNKSSQSVRDPRSAIEIQGLYFDIAFISVHGFSMDLGFSCQSAERQRMEQTVLSHSRRRVVLMDSSKVDVVCTYLICEPNGIDTLISDSLLSPAIRKKLSMLGVEVL